MSIFQSIQDKDVVRRIQEAKTRLVYVAPGVSAAIGEALESHLANPSGIQLIVVLDGDEEC